MTESEFHEAVREGRFHLGQKVVLYRLLDPRPLVVGYVGIERRPIMLNCAGCSRRDAVIHSMLGHGPSREQVLIYRRDIFFVPAYFCEVCTGLLDSGQSPLFTPFEKEAV